MGNYFSTGEYLEDAESVSDQSGFYQNEVSGSDDNLLRQEYKVLKLFEFTPQQDVG